MVREPDATMQPTPQNNQLMSKHRVLSLKPQLRLEWRGQDGQSETEQPDHSASLGDSLTSSTQTRFSVHTGAIRPICTPQLPSSHTCALDFFLAGDVYDLIASDRSWFGQRHERQGRRDSDRGI